MFRLSKNLIQKAKFQPLKPILTYSEENAVTVYKTTKKYHTRLMMQRTFGTLIISGFVGVGVRDMVRLSIYDPEEFKEVSKNDLLSVILRALVGQRENPGTIPATKGIDNILHETLGIEKDENRKGWWYGYILPGAAASIPLVALAFFYTFERRSLRNIIESVYILPKDPNAIKGPAVNDRVRITFLRSIDDYVLKKQRRYTVPKDDVRMNIGYDAEQKEYWRITLNYGDITPFVLPMLDKEDLDFHRKLAMKEFKPKVIKSKESDY